jgi:hypothetical protein
MSSGERLKEPDETSGGFEPVRERPTVGVALFITHGIRRQAVQNISPEISSGNPSMQTIWTRSGRSVPAPSFQLFEPLRRRPLPIRSLQVLELLFPVILIQVLELSGTWRCADGSRRPLHLLKITFAQAVLRHQDLELASKHRGTFFVADSVLGGDGGGVRIADITRQPLSPSTDHRFAPLHIHPSAALVDLPLEPRQFVARRGYLSVHGAATGITLTSFRVKLSPEVLNGLLPGAAKIIE